MQRSIENYVEKMFNKNSPENIELEINNHNTNIENKESELEPYYSYNCQHICWIIKNLLIFDKKKRISSHELLNNSQWL